MHSRRAQMPLARPKVDDQLITGMGAIMACVKLLHVFLFSS
jgi:hypothetical protein